MALITDVGNLLGRKHDAFPFLVDVTLQAGVLLKGTASMLIGVFLGVIYIMAGRLTLWHR